MQKQLKLFRSFFMSQPLVRIRNVKKRYGSGSGAVEALKGVSVDIMPGEIFGLLGVNGAGKTTLSCIIASLHPVTEGEVLFNGQSIYDDLINYRHQIGFCPQRPNYDKNFTVKENLLMAGRYYGMSTEQIDQRVQKLMKQFELEQYTDFNPNQLSGGYKQRLMIARSLVHSPKLLLLDEPTVGLDPHIRRHLWTVISDLKKQGVTVILTTHYLDEAEALSDRICILDKGSIRLIDTPANLLVAHKKGNLEDVFLALMDESELNQIKDN